MMPSVVVYLASIACSVLSGVNIRSCLACCKENNELSYNNNNNMFICIAP